jgi:hypothetical protein
MVQWRRWNNKLLLIAVSLLLLFLNASNLAIFVVYGWRDGGPFDGTSSSDRIRDGHHNFIRSNNYNESWTSTRHALPFLSANHTIQMLVASSNPGYVVATGTVELHCDRVSYSRSRPLFSSLRRQLTLVLEVAGQRFLPSDIIHRDLQGGNLVIAKFFVGVDLWRSLVLGAGGNSKQQQSSTTIHNMATLVDQLRAKDSQAPVSSAMITVDLPIFVDPATARNHRHFLAATTTVRKAYAFYDNDQFSNKKPTLWSDEKVTNLLHVWLKHHRAIGIEHFYIVDDEINASKPDLPVHGNDITYLRTGHPYDYMTPCATERSVAGQLVLENAILAAANTEWMLSIDVDEFVVPSNTAFNQSLPDLILHYQRKHCRFQVRRFKKTRVHICSKPSPHWGNVVYAISLLPQHLCSTSIKTLQRENRGFPIFSNDPRTMTVTDAPVFRQKTIVRPDLLESLSVHYPSPSKGRRFFEGRRVETLVRPQDGFLAHSRRVETCSKPWDPGRRESLHRTFFLYSSDSYLNKTQTPC